MLKAYKNDRLLFISDTHLPYMHDDALRFLHAVKQEVRPERVFHVGDLTDQYCFSRYPKDPEADGVPLEIKHVWRGVAQLGSLFPSMTIVSSNHDDRVYSRSRSAGVPKGFLRPYPELIKSGGYDWKWVHDYTLRLPNKQHVYIVHTKGESSVALAKNIGMNVVVGHHHTKHGIQYFANPHHNLFCVDTGCLISDDNYAFAYNKSSIIRPVLGCAAIIDSKPMLFTMRTGKNGRWLGSL